MTAQTYLTADTHFGHRRLVDWGRPEDFNEQIVKNWNKTIKATDTILHLGDLTMTSFEETEKYVRGFNGIKYMILGNHDSRSANWYRKLGFEVLPEIFWKYQDKYGKWRSLLFTHIPVPDLPTDWINIHGHLHGNGHREKPEFGNYVDVGVDNWGFAPVKLNRILTEIFSL